MGTIAALLQAGGPIAARAKNRVSWTPLHCAARTGLLGGIAPLVQAGADKDGRTQWGETPLHLAAQNSHVDCVKELLRLGADRDAENNVRPPPPPPGHRPSSQQPSPV